MKGRDYAAERELIIEGQRLGMRRQGLYEWVNDQLYGDHEEDEPVEEPVEVPAKKAKKKAKKKTAKKSSKG